MNKERLEKDEQALLDVYEDGRFISDLTDERKAQLAAGAREAFKKDKRMNVRISTRDLEALKRRALEEGLPYQTLVSSVLHKYLSGGLEDVTASKSAQRTRRRQS